MAAAHGRAVASCRRTVRTPPAVGIRHLQLGAQPDEFGFELLLALA